MLFEFVLRPLEEVQPWGVDEPTLHWFGLTDGWYWIEAGDFRSKLSFTFAYILQVLAESGRGQAAPVVTIPAQ